MAWGEKLFRSLLDLDLALGHSVWAVCKLEWLIAFWDNAVDVSHDQPFKAHHGYRRECYGAVGI